MFNFKIPFSRVINLVVELAWLWIRCISLELWLKSNSRWCTLHRPNVVLHLQYRMGKKHVPSVATGEASTTHIIVPLTTSLSQHRRPTSPAHHVWVYADFKHKIFKFHAIHTDIYIALHHHSCMYNYTRWVLIKIIAF